MSGTVTTYDSKQTTVVINNMFITGFAEGSFVSWEKSEDNFSSKTDAFGDTSVAITNNNKGVITVTLSQTSPQLPELKRLANARETFPIWVTTNGSIQEKVGGTQAMIKKTPGGTLSDEVEDREIEIEVFDYTDE